MSAAAIAVQRALVTALAAAPGLAALTGIYDGPPADAAFPYCAVSDGTTTDWSTKTEQGREHRLSIALWDDGVQPGRLHALLAASEEVIAALPRDLAGQRIVSLAFLRSRVVRDAAGPWVARSDWRVRTVEI
jgi:hypothetical protein